MRAAYHPAPEFKYDLLGQSIYAIFLTLFAIAEATSRIYARYVVPNSEPHPARGSLATEAHSQATIATSCALMAKSMLQSSERRSRPERLSRL